MSTHTDSDSDIESTDTVTDPRLDTPFGQAFADSTTRTDELALLLAELRNDPGLRSLLAETALKHLKSAYETIDDDTQIQLANLIAKNGYSGLFPYRNALVDAYLVNIEPGDRVFTVQNGMTRESGHDETVEYEVVCFQDNTTEAVLREVANYDPDSALVVSDTLDDRTRVPYSEVATGDQRWLTVNCGQLRFDESWYVHKPPQSDPDNEESDA